MSLPVASCLRDVKFRHLLFHKAGLDLHQHKTFRFYPFLRKEPRLRCNPSGIHQRFWCKVVSTDMLLLVPVSSRAFSPRWIRTTRLQSYLRVTTLRCLQAREANTGQVWVLGPVPLPNCWSMTSNWSPCSNSPLTTSCHFRSRRRSFGKTFPALSTELRVRR